MALFLLLYDNDGDDLTADYARLAKAVATVEAADADWCDLLSLKIRHWFLQGGRWTMYVSRLTFHTNPGQTNQVEQELHSLMAMVKDVGGVRPRILRNHFASLGAADVVFEQEAPNLETLETQIHQVTEKEEFQKWSDHMSGLLAQSPKREVYLVVE